MDTIFDPGKNLCSGFFSIGSSDKPIASQARPNHAALNNRASTTVSPFSFHYMTLAGTQSANSPRSFRNKLIHGEPPENVLSEASPL
jgi:hypothetical protein